MSLVADPAMYVSGHAPEGEGGGMDNPRGPLQTFPRWNCYCNQRVEFPIPTCMADAKGQLQTFMQCNGLALPVYKKLNTIHVIHL